MTMMATMRKILTPGGIPMKLSLPRAFCCVLYAVCWLDTTSTFRQKSNDENDGESEVEEDYRGKRGRRGWWTGRKRKMRGNLKSSRPLHRWLHSTDLPSRRPWMITNCQFLNSHFHMQGSHLSGGLQTNPAACRQHLFQ